MAFLEKAGSVVAGIGVVGMIWLSDLLSGYTKAERMGKVVYTNTSAKRKKKWLIFLISLAVTGVGLLMQYLARKG